MRQVHHDLRNGEWEFAAFTADGKLNAQFDTKVCMECYKPHGGLGPGAYH
jgi:hypothetical protein